MCSTTTMPPRSPVPMGPTAITLPLPMGDTGVPAGSPAVPQVVPGMEASRECRVGVGERGVLAGEALDHDGPGFAERRPGAVHRRTRGRGHRGRGIRRLGRIRPHRAAAAPAQIVTTAAKVRGWSFMRVTPCDDRPLRRCPSGSRSLAILRASSRARCATLVSPCPAGWSHQDALRLVPAGRNDRCPWSGQSGAIRLVASR